MPAEFHWLRPEWLLAVPLVVAAAILLGRGKLGVGSWERVIAPSLMPFVLSRDPGKGSDRRWWLLGIGGVVAALSMAGPAWERIEQPVFRAEQALVIAMDLSRSMDAQDMMPSRLVRARLKILDILERRKTGQTALVIANNRLTFLNVNCHAHQGIDDGKGIRAGLDAAPGVARDVGLVG